MDPTEFFLSKLIVVELTKAGIQSLGVPYEAGQRILFCVETKHPIKDGYKLISIETTGNFSYQFLDLSVAQETPPTTLFYPNDEKVSFWGLPTEKEISDFRNFLKVISEETPSFSREFERILSLIKKKKGAAVHV